MIFQKNAIEHKNVRFGVKIVMILYTMSYVTLSFLFKWTLPIYNGFPRLWIIYRVINPINLIKDAYLKFICQ